MMSYDQILNAAKAIIAEYRDSLIASESIGGKRSTLPPKVRDDVQRMDEVIRELRRRVEASRPRLRAEDPDYGGVLGADNQVHSDADPGL